jgi:hypothetical protein
MAFWASGKYFCIMDERGDDDDNVIGESCCRGCSVEDEEEDTTRP